MKYLLLSLIAFSGSFAAAACPVFEDLMHYQVYYAPPTGPATAVDGEFKVFSSTYLCDGRSNRYFYKEIPVGTGYVAVIYASYEKVSMRVVSSATSIIDSISRIDSARAAGDLNESKQMLHTQVSPGEYVSIELSTRSRGN